MAKAIQVRLILEILGRPPEHIVQGLSMLIEKMKQEKGIKIVHFKIHEPVLAKDSKDMFTTFADIDVEVDGIHDLYFIIFNYMPANIEVIYPENIELNNNDLNQAMNQLAHRLHNYDAVTKKVLAERDFLVEKLKEVAPHLFQPVQQTPVQTVPAEKVKKSRKPKIKSKKGKKK